MFPVGRRHFVRMQVIPLIIVDIYQHGNGPFLRIQDIKLEYSSPLLIDF